MFDLLGVISPCIVLMKTLLQELWKHDLTLDEQIPKYFNKLWNSFRKDLHLIKQIDIRKYFLNSSCFNIEIEFQTLCDASENAYCAAVYVRCILSISDICVSVLTFKTKVSPLNTRSLLRL